MLFSDDKYTTSGGIFARKIVIQEVVSGAMARRGESRSGKLVGRFGRVF
jgi:hypothetical protein